MEPELKLITINGKEYQLDIEQAKKLNLLKEKDSKIKSWEEFKEKYKNVKGHWVEVFQGKIVPSINVEPTCVQLTSYEAKAIVAFSKLLKLRRDWIGEWEPNWTESKECKYCICNELKGLDIIELTVDHFIFF